MEHGTPIKRTLRGTLIWENYPCCVAVFEFLLRGSRLESKPSTLYSKLQDNLGLWDVDSSLLFFETLNP